MKKPVEPRELIRALVFPSDRADVIHAFVGGSALHGIKLQGTDDTDVYGIYIEKPLGDFAASLPRTRSSAGGAPG
jgi:hypothetical protein